MTKAEMVRSHIEGRKTPEFIRKFQESLKYELVTIEEGENEENSDSD